MAGLRVRLGAPCRSTCCAGPGPCSVSGLADLRVARLHSTASTARRLTLAMSTPCSNFAAFSFVVGRVGGREGRPPQRKIYFAGRAGGREGGREGGGQGRREGQPPGARGERGRSLALAPVASLTAPSGTTPPFISASAALGLLCAFRRPRASAGPGAWSSTASPFARSPPKETPEKGAPRAPKRFHSSMFCRGAQRCASAFQPAPP